MTGASETMTSKIIVEINTQVSNEGIYFHFRLFIIHINAHLVCCLVLYSATGHIQPLPPSCQSFPACSHLCSAYRAIGTHFSHGRETSASLPPAFPLVSQRINYSH